MRRQIIFYKTSDGRSIIEDFLDSLSDKIVQKIIAVLRLIEEQDIIPEKFFKKLTGTNIWECRIKWKSDIFRIFCFFDKGNVIVLTHGIQKKTHKTPKKEIEKAEKYRQDYLSRKEEL